jgi:hypothetical protein
MSHTLICGDCLEVMKSIQDPFVDLTVFSPPYDAIRDYGSGNKIDLTAIGSELFRLTKDGGVCVVVLQDGTKDFKKSGTTFRTAVNWMDMGWGLFETLIYKRNGRPGAWWGQRFRVDHEYMLVFLKDCVLNFLTRSI